MRGTGEPRHARPPHLLLDGVAGWRMQVHEGVTLTPSQGHWTLEPLPGQAERLIALPLQEAAFRCPAALAEEACGGLLVADAALHRVKRLATGCSGPVVTLPFGGGPGSAPRRLREPRGVAALPGGVVAVADTGNHRLQGFAPVTWALLWVLGAGDRRPRAGDRPLEFDRPWGLAAAPCGALWVADRGNRRLQKIRPDRRSAEIVGAGELVDPTDLAVAPDGRVAVADPGAERVVLYSPSGRQLDVLEGLQLPSSVAFGAGGRLYVGDGIGRVHVFVPELAPAGGGRPGRRGTVHACGDHGPTTARPSREEAVSWRRVGSGVTGLDGAIVDLLWSREGDLVALVKTRPVNPGDRLTRTLWRIDPAAAYAGAPPRPSGRRDRGSLVTEALDSGIEACVWHRVELDAAVPPGTSIEIDSFTSEVDPPAAGDPADPGFPHWQRGVLAGAFDSARLPAYPDCLVQSAPGRYLWLRLRLRTDGLATPELRSLEVSYPRRSYLRYLPAVFQEDDESRRFLERFLAIFQTPLEDLNGRLDRLWQLYDPAAVPAPHLRWLAAWLAVVVDPEWPAAKLREVIGRAVAAYKLRGTAPGLEQALRDYAGVEDGAVLEHYRLRRWPALSLAARLDGSARLWSRDFYQRLQLSSYSQLGYFRLTEDPEPALEPLDWGAHRFSVLFPADPYRLEETRRRVAAVVEREKPAHTTATLCPVYPRLRVGVQASVGLDARVAGVSHLVLNRLATLSYDTVLACSPAELALGRLGATSRPRAGVSTRLQ